MISQWLSRLRSPRRADATAIDPDFGIALPGRIKACLQDIRDSRQLLTAQTANGSGLGKARLIEAQESLELHFTTAPRSREGELINLLSTTDEGVLMFSVLVREVRAASHRWITDWPDLILRQQSRAARRVAVDRRTGIALMGLNLPQCRVIELSESGATLMLRQPVPLGRTRSTYGKIILSDLSIAIHDPAIKSCIAAGDRWWRVGLSWKRVDAASETQYRRWLNNAEVAKT